MIEEGVAENNQTSPEEENVEPVKTGLNFVLGGKQQEVVGASVKGFGLQGGQKSRWEVLSTSFSQLLSVDAI